MTSRFMKSLAVVMALGFAAIASSQSAEAGRGTRNFVLGTIAGVAGVAAIGSLSRHRYYDRDYGYYDAGYRYRRHRYGYGNRYRYRRHNYYYNDRYNSRPRYRTYYAPRRAHRGRYATWSPEWYRHCARKYRSFRRSDGTFQPYKGGRRLCR